MALQFDDERQDRKLRELRVEEEEELARILADRYKMKYVDLTGISIDTDALRLLDEEAARASNVAVFDAVGKKIQVALQSPSQENAMARLRNLEERGYIVIPFVVSKKSLDYAWDRYKDLSYSVESKAGTLDVSNDAIRKIMEAIKSVEDVRKIVAETMALKKSFRVSRVVEIIVAGAIATKASDIHVEPEDEHVRLRYRLDGVLVDVLLFDKETYFLLLSRIKLLSGVKLNVRTAAQDGRFSIVIDQKEIEVRMSTLPGAYAESIVMRLLDPSSLSIGLETLGM